MTHRLMPCPPSFGCRNSFHVAITACAQNHDLHRGVAFYQEMHASQLAANVVTYAQLINLCSACGHAAGVEEAFSTALSRGHFAGAVTSSRHPCKHRTQPPALPASPPVLAVHMLSPIGWVGIFLTGCTAVVEATPVAGSWGDGGREGGGVGKEKKRLGLLSNLCQSAGSWLGSEITSGCRVQPNQKKSQPKKQSALVFWLYKELKAFSRRHSVFECCGG